ncbi:MAG TPA: glycoside hydrolase family 16 protein [Candidatus Dormibacteraeota bacterium]|nr:glycoside hydrolase family 16 protein [Candidatus Dormibacteraeota bacterium]
MVVLLGATFMPFAAAQASAASLSIAPASGPAGATVQVVGAGFVAGARAQLTWDGTASGMPAVKIGAAGDFRITITVPAAPSGSHHVGAVDSGLLPKGRAKTTQQVTLLAVATFVEVGVGPAPTPTNPAPAPTPRSTATPQSTPNPTPTQAPTPPPAPTATAAPTAAPGTGIPAMPQADLLQKDFADGSLWPFRVIDYPNSHPADAMSYACDYGRDSSVASVHDGYLQLTAYPRSDGRWNCGFVSTGMDGNGNGASFSMTHGYVQFAARLNVGYATWQAPLWLLNTVTGWNSAEVDVAEVMAGRLTCNLHGVGDLQIASVAPSADLATTWHVFGVAKTSDHITFVMDGKILGRWNGSMPDPLALLADSKVGYKWNSVYPDGSTPDPTYVKIAWVTVASSIPNGL